MVSDALRITSNRVTSRKRQKKTVLSNHFLVNSTSVVNREVGIKIQRLSEGHSDPIQVHLSHRERVQDMMDHLLKGLLQMSAYALSKPGAR